MKDKLTTNLVGVIPVDKIRAFVPDFNPNSYDVDEIIKKIIEKDGAGWLVNEVMFQFNNSKIKESQKVSLNYFLGNNDVKNPNGSSVMILNPFTGLHQEVADANPYFESKIALPFHKNAIRDLTNFTLGAKESKIVFNTKESISDKTEQETIKLSKVWNVMSELERDLVEDYFLFGFSGTRWRVKEEKNLLGKSEWKLLGERIEPANVWALTLGRVENKLNNADVIITYDVKVDRNSTEVKAELFTNKAMYVLNYQIGKAKEGQKAIGDSVRYPLWVKGGKEVDMIKPPFSFMEADKYGQVLINDYKSLIDASDNLINKTTEDSIHHDESLLFIKNSGMGSNFKIELEAELAALGNKRKDGQRGYKAIVADNNDADIKNLDNELPTAHSEFTFKVLNDKLFDAAGILDFNSDNTNENYNAIKLKWTKVLNKIVPVRGKLTRHKVKVLEIFAVFENQLEGGKAIAEEIVKKLPDVIIKYDNGYMINELDQQNAIATGVGAKFISLKTAAETSEFAADDEYERIKEEIELREKLSDKPATNSSETSQGNRQGGTTTGDIRQMK